MMYKEGKKNTFMIYASSNAYCIWWWKCKQYVHLTTLFTLPWSCIPTKTRPMRRWRTSTRWTARTWRWRGASTSGNSTTGPRAPWPAVMVSWHLLVDHCAPVSFVSFFSTVLPIFLSFPYCHTKIINTHAITSMHHCLYKFVDYWVLYNYCHPCTSTVISIVIISGKINDNNNLIIGRLHRYVTLRCDEHRTRLFRQRLRVGSE